MVIEVDAPPTANVSVPVPMVVAAEATGFDDRLAAAAKFCTCMEY